MSIWSFRRRHGVCTVCERAFEDGEPHYSTLAVRGEEVARDDLCRACWRERAPATSAELEGDATAAQASDDLFWWRTRHEAGKRKGVALNYEVIEALFLGLEQRTERHLRELRYVLCLLLMRKRRLKIVRIVRDSEGESMLVRRPRRTESLRVFVYEFDAERMDALRGELMRLFDSEEGETLAAGSEGEVATEDGAPDPALAPEPDQDSEGDARPEPASAAAEAG